MGLRPEPGAFGVASRPPTALLVERAHDLLAGGPADAVELVGRVFQMPVVPPAVAEHLATELLACESAFVRDEAGKWWRSDLRRAAIAADVRAGDAVGAAPADEPLADASRPLASLSFAVVDVETTGGRPEGGDRVTEIAIVQVRDGRIAETYESLVNPRRPIPSFITKLTGIHWDMVKDAPAFGALHHEVRAALAGRVFVAHNAGFDWRFVDSEMWRASGERLAGPRLCTVRLARKLLPQLPRRSLDHVANHFGFGFMARHRALGDAEVTARVLLKLLDAAGDRGCTTWGDLEALLAPGTSRARKRRSAAPRPASGEEGA